MVPIFPQRLVRTDGLTVVHWRPPRPLPSALPTTPSPGWCALLRYGRGGGGGHQAHGAVAFGPSLGQKAVDLDVGCLSEADGGESQTSQVADPNQYVLSRREFQNFGRSKIGPIMAMENVTFGTVFC